LNSDCWRYQLVKEATVICVFYRRLKTSLDEFQTKNVPIKNVTVKKIQKVIVKKLKIVIMKKFKKYVMKKGKSSL
jgi:hypothetical protein